jgi:hypothetical protein
MIPGIRFDIIESLPHEGVIHFPVGSYFPAAIEPIPREIQPVKPRIAKRYYSTQNWTL